MVSMLVDLLVQIITLWDAGGVCTVIMTMCEAALSSVAHIMRLDVMK